MASPLKSASEMRRPMSRSADAAWMARPVGAGSPPSDAKASKPSKPAQNGAEGEVAARCVGPLVDHGDDREAAHGQGGEHHPGHVRQRRGDRLLASGLVEQLEDGRAGGDRIDGDRIEHQLDVADARGAQTRRSAAAISAAEPRSGGRSGSAALARHATLPPGRWTSTVTVRSTSLGSRPAAWQAASTRSSSGVSRPARCRTSRATRSRHRRAAR